MNIMDWNPLRRRTDVELAAMELDNAKRNLLEANSNREYWDATITFNEERIDRLQRYLRGAE